MRRLLSAALMVASISTGTTVLTAAPAAAGAQGCVTYAEFRKVLVGMKKTQVHRQVFDLRGQSAGGSAGGYTRFYGSCYSVRIGGGDGGAYVTYGGDTGRVLEKRWL